MFGDSGNAGATLTYAWSMCSWGVTAVHVNTRSLVWTTRLLCTIVRTLCLACSSARSSLNLNVPSGVHVDARNHALIDNALVPLSLWQGSELWHECLDGDVLLQQDGPKVLCPGGNELAA